MLSTANRVASERIRAPLNHKRAGDHFHQPLARLIGADWIATPYYLPALCAQSISFSWPCNTTRAGRRLVRLDRYADLAYYVRCYGVQGADRRGTPGPDEENPGRKDQHRIRCRSRHLEAVSERPLPRPQDPERYRLRRVRF